jgi:ABC-2 type transport system ATP-binding protein
MVAQLHLALIMAIDARLLILDEPTLGLDILYRKAFYDSLLNDYFTEDRTIVVTTHQVEEIENILTDLVFIREGQLVLDDSMEAVGERFIELEPSSETLEQARALGPISQRRSLGRHSLLFDGVDREQLEALGQTSRPTVADLFVAFMGERNEEAAA